MMRATCASQSVANSWAFFMSPVLRLLNVALLVGMYLFVTFVGDGCDFYLSTAHGFCLLKKEWKCSTNMTRIEH